MPVSELKTIQLRKIALVGSPNVGKSLVFNHLSSSYATVSNYPGTTVGVMQGKSKIAGVSAQIIDTPGMYSIIPITEEEKVARSILTAGDIDLVIHVVDAKNIDRMLPLTLQLLEAGFPLILCLNMMDELEDRKLKIDCSKLAAELQIPVVGTSAMSGKGIDQLKEAIRNYRYKSIKVFSYLKKYLSHIINDLEKAIHGDYVISKRAIALLLLQEDEEIEAQVFQKEGNHYSLIIEKIKDIKNKFNHSFNYIIAMQRQVAVEKIIHKVYVGETIKKNNFSERLSQLMLNPWTGLPILALVLYFGLYQFVGVFGGGTLVDWIEGGIFDGYINPFLISLFEKMIPWVTFRELFTGEYGILTMGVRYAVALVLPIVGSFFLVFAIIEDSGYLPRLAMLLDRVFKKIGLNGRAVIPIVLGFGCDTMATIVTRILETKRERVITTLLLALAIPCSAQLGVILAILSPHPKALILWAVIIAVEFLLIGFLSSKALPGTKPNFYIELPPLRLPKFSNVFLKTMSRMQWYFTEVFPLFIIASILIWIGQVTGIFQLLIQGLEPVVQALGLPPQAAVAFLFGFFRRDYGAAGLFDLNEAGLMTGANLLVACVVLTLFLPCIAQLLVMKKEHGYKITFYISLFVLIVAFGTGLVLNFCLNLMRQVF